MPEQLIQIVATRSTLSIFHSPLKFVGCSEIIKKKFMSLEKSLAFSKFSLIRNLKQCTVGEKSRVEYSIVGRNAEYVCV